MNIDIYLCIFLAFGNILLAEVITTKQKADEVTSYVESSEISTVYNGSLLQIDNEATSWNFSDGSSEVNGLTPVYNSLQANDTIAADNSVEANDTIAVYNSTQDNDKVLRDDSMEANKTISVYNSTQDNDKVLGDDSMEANEMTSAYNLTQVNDTTSVFKSTQANEMTSADSSLEANKTISVYNSTQDNDKVLGDDSMEANEMTSAYNLTQVNDTTSVFKSTQANKMTSAYNLTQVNDTTSVFKSTQANEMTSAYDSVQNEREEFETTEAKSRTASTVSYVTSVIQKTTNQSQVGDTTDVPVMDSTRQSNWTSKTRTSSSPSVNDADGFYPYNPSKDARLPQSDDISQRIYTEQGFPFYNTLHHELYVGSNGIISFSMEFNPFWNFPMQYAQKITPIVAPFWGDVDISCATVDVYKRWWISTHSAYYRVPNIYYRVHQKSLTSADTNTDMVFKRAVIDVQKYSSISNFHPSWILVVTWDTVPPYPCHYWIWINPKKLVTYQAVLMTDGIVSFVVFNYKRGEMNWGSKRNWWEWVPLVNMGYSSLFKYSSVQYSRTLLMHQLDTIRSNTGISGKWFYPLFNEDGNKASAQKCWNWYWKDSEKWQATYIQKVNDGLPACPCTFWQAWWDRRYWVNWWTYCAQLWRPLRRFGTWSRRCCYNGWWGSLETVSPKAGSLLSYHPWRERVKHQKYDEDPKQYCCIANLCHLYYERRPVSTCDGYVPLQWAWIFGDPHITTLDEKTYTFNGYGEYVMLEWHNTEDSFLLQARTALVETVNSTQTNATVFSAFAAKDSADAMIHVELSSTKDSLIIYANGRDLTSPFYANSSFQWDEVDNLVVKRETNTTVSTMFINVGVTLNITVEVKMLTVSVAAPQSFENNTRGLMGIYNKNQSDDFTIPNGTVLHPNSTEREIFFNFGQLWHINASESILRYPKGKGPRDYTHYDFVPTFSDDADPAKREKAKRICGDNKQCVFDYLATENRDLAVNTKRVEDEGTQLMAALNNVVPSLSGNATVYAVVNETVTINVHASDADGSSDTLQYILINSPDSNFNFSSNNNLGVLTWFPENLDPVNISLTVRDSHNATAPVLGVNIYMCSGCSNHGSCTYQLLDEDSPSNTPSYHVVQCSCSVGWTGKNCDTDFDACISSPCMEGSNCTDLTPETQQQFNKSHNCSDCSTGYQEVDGKCADIDECNGTAVCAQYCINTDGSYTCECYSGYSKQHGECLDIDECFEFIDGCQQKCSNMNGFYVCNCHYGYALNADNRTCNQILNICEQSNLSCEYGCLNDSGKPICMCPRGYETKSDGLECKDVDECALFMCSQKCTNSEGSYTCGCYDGYTLGIDKKSCEECEAIYWGYNCSRLCECGDRALHCDRQRGCICAKGWEGQSCEVDVDECQTQIGVCSSEQICLNTQGSYKCKCPKGYRLTTKGTCLDVDECADADLNTCVALCENTPGGFTCRCRPGYQGENCDIDINECSSSLAVCEQDCENVPGLYNCICEEGFQLKADRKSCQKVEDLCGNVRNCSYGCMKHNGSVTCFCQRGYKLSANQKNCQDIDECATGSHNCNQICTNTPSSYNCSCQPGYKLENDGCTCTECDAYHWGENCGKLCNCSAIGTVRCSSTQGCQCFSGWMGDRCHQELDECSSANNMCSENSLCINTPGSFHCFCTSGYTLNISTHWCDDVNECSKLSTNTCDQKCENNVGSYQCRCNKGFIYKRGRCADIDECALKKDSCQQICQNTKGHYKCGCKSGFLLNMTDRISCYAQKGCQAQNNCSSACVHKNGQDMCYCARKGYQLDLDGVTCIDIEECNSSSHFCSQHCQNLPGSYQCSCSPGFELNTDNVTCKECDFWHWGPNCSNSCVCSSHTQSCNKTNGDCSCYPGWQGSKCDLDIDECSSHNISCGNNSQCKNIKGSYICVCSLGFTRIGNYCIACSQYRWGDNCAYRSNCSDKTLNWSPINGTCFCQQGWTSQNCDDIDECFFNSSLCSSNSICINTPGSYQCSCEDGYFKDSNNFCAKKSKRYTMNITFDWQAPLEIVNKTSDTYKVYEKLCTDEFRKFYSTVPGFQSVLINDIRRGSLVVQHTVILDAGNSQKNAGWLIQLLHNQATNGFMRINGTSIAISSISLIDNDSSSGPVRISKSGDICQIFIQIISCPFGTECKVNQQTNVPGCATSATTPIISSTTISASSSTDLSLVLGLSIGLPLGLALIILAAFLIRSYWFKIKRTRRFMSTLSRRQSTVTPLSQPADMSKGWLTEASGKDSSISLINEMETASPLDYLGYLGSGQRNS